MDLKVHVSSGEPYTAASSLVCQLGNQIPIQSLLSAHLVTLTIIAPEGPWGVLPDDLNRWLSISREGNSASWTNRLANGAVDFVEACAARVVDPPLKVVFINLECASPLDREFLAVLQRRASPKRVQLRFQSSTDDAGEPLRAPPAVKERARFDPYGAGPTALLNASNRCMHLAYYDAALKLAQAGLERTRAERGSTHGGFARNALFAKLMLGHLSDVEADCSRHFAESKDPQLLSRCAYAMSMLYARRYAPAKRNYAVAHELVEKALAFVSQIENAENRFITTAFLKNALALVESRMGHFERAHELLREGLGQLTGDDRDVKYEEERILLLHNLARLYTMTNRPSEAIEQLTNLLARRHDTSAYFDRGVLHHRLACYLNALEDFDSAIRWSPPYAEAHLQRAKTLLRLGRTAEALDACARAEVLAPDDPAVRVNRATILFKLGDSAAAITELDQALALREDANALYNRGRILESCGRLTEAVHDYARAVDLAIPGAERVRSRIEAIAAEVGH